MNSGICATIAITRYREPDALVHDVIRHACRQTGVKGEVLFLDQQTGSGDLPADCETRDWLVRRIECSEIGLSSARNQALQMARFDNVLFLDADALAEPDWALKVCTALSMPGVAIVGSRIEPLWSTTEPFFARSQVVRDQYSLYDLGRETKDVKRIVGAAFGVRRDLCAEQMFFDDGLGRRQGRLFGGEETDLCTRVRAAGGRVVYIGQAAVRHVIPAARERLSWVSNRLFYSGHNRATLGGRPSPSRRLALVDWLLMPLILPPYAAGWIWGRIFFKNAERKDEQRSSTN